MTPRRFGLVVRTAALLACLVLLPLSSRAATLDESAPSGGNRDKAEFRFWYPDDATADGGEAKPHTSVPFR